MLLSLLVALLAVAYALVRGGSLDKLAETRFRWPPLLFAGLVLQLGFDLWNPGFLTNTAKVAILVVSQLMVASLLALNWQLPGMRLAALGMGLNALVIGLNGAMPVSLDAARIAGLGPEGAVGIKHDILGPQTLLPWLGDVIPVPILHKVASIGDVVLAVGIGRFAYCSATRSEEHEHLKDELEVNV
jgi:hypothetical protein